MKSKKNSFLLLSFTFLVIAVLLHIVGLFQITFAALGTILISLAIVTYVLIKLYEDTRILNKLIVYLFFFISGLVLLGFFPNLGLAAKFLYIVFTSVLSYLYLISANIYFVAEKKEEKIPLLEAARFVVSIFFVITVFLGSTSIYKIPLFLNFSVVNLVFKLILFGLFYYFLLKNFRWYFLLTRVGEFTDEFVQKVRELILIEVIILTQFSITLCFFPFENFGRGALIAGVSYIINNFIQNYLSHRMNSRFLTESITIFILLYLFVYLL